MTKTIEDTEGGASEGDADIDANEEEVAVNDVQGADNSAQILGTYEHMTTERSGDAKLQFWGSRTDMVVLVSFGMRAKFKL